MSWKISTYIKKKEKERQNKKAMIKWSNKANRKH